ncbi:MAG: hypothetical protein KDH96_09010 [Candidatus Riesia sp.]|nr:hypothetical protein [Candidatus Riesia sp.]
MIDKKRPKILLVFSLGVQKILEKVYKTYNDVVSHYILTEMSYKSLSDISYIDRARETDMVTFTMADRVIDDIDERGLEYNSKEIFNVRPGWTENRQRLKIGRLIRKLTDDRFSAKEIEDFVNRFKSISKKDVDGLKWKRVHGSELNYWYYNENYVRGGGTLNRSCLRKSNKNHYINFLSGNPNKIRMLLLLNENNKLLARALMWKLTEPVGRIYMDRIYSRFDEDVNLFTESAVKNGWLYKSKQTYGGDVNVIDGRNGEEKWVKMVVDGFEKLNFAGYPYMDTFQYYDPIKKIITNDVKMFNNNKILKLNKTNGGYTSFDDDDIFVIGDEDE